MKETALWLLVVVIAGCSGTKSNSGPPFLEGLAVSKESRSKYSVEATYRVVFSSRTRISSVLRTRA